VLCECILSYFNYLECVGRCINSDFVFACDFTKSVFVVVVVFCFFSKFYAHVTGLCLLGYPLRITHCVFACYCAFMCVVWQRCDFYITYFVFLKIFLC
jgi:hypothetical protein